MKFDFANETFSKDDVEIFAAGRWHKDDYTENDIDNLVVNFNQLIGTRKVPLKLGHDPKQKMAQQDGFPAIGWITELKRSGSKLLAKIESIPKAVKELIDNKAYGAFSSEIFWNYSQGGNIYRRVLKAVALLGADIPEVNSISDIVGRFSELEGNGEVHAYHTEFREGEQDMDKIEEMKKQIDDQGVSIKNMTAATEAASKENVELKAKLEMQQKEAEANQKATERVAVYAAIDEGVKAGKVAPAIREKLAALVLGEEKGGLRTYSYKDGDATKVLEFKNNQELLADVIKNMPQVLDTKNYTTDGNIDPVKIKDQKDDQKDFSVDAESGRRYSTDASLDEKARAIMDKNKEISYSDALVIAQKGEV